jgi:chromosome segregation ATPase
MSMHQNQPAEDVISRRWALHSSALAVVGLLSSTVVGQSEKKEEGGMKLAPRLPNDSHQRTERPKSSSGWTLDSGGNEERRQAMMEQIARQRRQAFESLKDQLQVSDAEWPVVKRRLQPVYDLVFPVPLMMGRHDQSKTELEQRTVELRELLREKTAPTDQIKAKLAAVRAAKEQARQELAQARQSLRQIMNLRQEAVLVLNGLLD